MYGSTFQTQSRICPLSNLYTLMNLCLVYPFSHTHAVKSVHWISAPPPRTLIRNPHLRLTIAPNPSDVGDQPDAKHADQPHRGAVHHGRPPSCGATAVSHHRAPRFPQHPRQHQGTRYSFTYTRTKIPATEKIIERRNGNVKWSRSIFLQGLK